MKKKTRQIEWFTEKCRKIQTLWCPIIYCMSFWVSKGNWFKLDPLVYCAHPYLIIGGLTSHCLLDLRFDFSFRIGAKIFFEFFFISSLYGYFKFHSFSEKKMYNYKTFCRLESKFVNFSISEKFIYVIFPTTFTKTEFKYQW